MPTLVSRRVRKGPRLASERIRRIGDRMLEALGLADAELSVLFVGDERMAALNRVHRKQDKPTDVLAFPVDEHPTPGSPRLLGDVVISLPTAWRQARSRRRRLFAEVRFLLAHGLLHLVGYDHATRIQKKRMDAAARRLVRAAGGTATSSRPPPRHVK